MRNILAADWFRARKGGIVSLAAVTVGVVLLVIVCDIPNIYMFDYMSSSIPASYLTLSGFVGAFVCGVSADRAFQEGGIRNKVVTGTTRSKTFWAAYIVNTLITFVAAAAYLAVVFMIGTPLGFRNPAELTENIWQGLPGIAAFTAMYSLIAAVWPRKHVMVVMLIVAIVLMVISNSILMGLMEPEMYSPIAYTFIDGVGDMQLNEPAELIPNPNYIAEPARAWCIFFINFLPTGQGMQLQASERIGFLPIYAAGWCAVCFAVSLIVLKRRNLQ